MDVPGLGATAVGIVVGFFLFLYIRKQSAFTAKGLAAFLGVALAGVVVTFLGVQLGGGRLLYGSYGIGLFIGVALYAVMYRMNNGKWPVWGLFRA